MNYNEYAPSPRLRPFVDRIWTLDGPAGAGGIEPVLPDGHLEIIVHAADPFVEVGPDDQRRRQSPLLLAGQLTRATRIGPAGVTRVVGARLRPNGVHALLGVPQWHVTDRVVDLSAVHRGLARTLHDDVSGREQVDDLVTAFDRALVRIAPAFPPASRAAWAVRAAVARKGLIGVRGLARAAGLGDRQLQRAFQEEVGLTPKRLLRILRFQEVLGQVRRPASSRTWADLAAACGFYDQAHFVNDFRSFTGRTPGEWAIDDSSLTAVFSAIRRVRRQDLEAVMACHEESQLS
jgi:AraC-like DNA-binding protein